MTNRSIVLTVFGIAVLALSSAPASAQGLNNKEVVAQVDFEFQAGEKTLPAGSYTISATDVGATTVTIRPSGSKEVTTVPVITRLALRKGPSRAVASNLVFDAVGGKRFLSEVWIPGREGYLVRGTAETHEHVLVDSTK